LSLGNSSDDTFNVGRYRPIPLFLERVSAYWKFVWKCWRTAFDWTVLLYIVVPAIWIGGGNYLDWLRNPPLWMSGIPAALPLALVGLVFSGGRLRTFADAGDGLFLNRNRTWTKGFTGMGLVYSAGVHTVLSVSFIPLLLPLWNDSEGYSAGFLTGMAVCSILWGMSWTLLRDLISRTGIVWWKRILLFLLRTVSVTLFVGVGLMAAKNTYFWGAAAGIVGVATIGIGRLRFRARGTFLHELGMEREAFLSAVGWLLRDTMEKKTLPKLSRPVFLSRSVTLFRKRGTIERLAESWIKSLFRRFDNVRLLLFFTVLGALAVGLVPLFLSFAVWLVLPLLLLGWLQGQWRYWLSEDFVSLFRWEEETAEKAGEKARFLLSLPIVCLWAVEIAVRLGFVYGGAAWIGLAAVPAAGWIWLRAANKVVTGADRFRRQLKGNGRRHVKQVTDA
jgi:ABC-2 type transport system permease protein